VHLGMQVVLAVRAAANRRHDRGIGVIGEADHAEDYLGKADKSDSPALRHVELK